MSEFSFTYDQALLAVLMESFHKCDQAKRTQTLGRKQLQKLCYFAQWLGAPLSYRFRIHYYGPYSDDLAFDTDMLTATKVFVDDSPDPASYSNLRPGPNIHAPLKQYEGKLADQHKSIIAKLVTALAPLSPRTLELLSTMHFINHRLKASGYTAGRDDIFERLRGLKKEKFTPEEMERAYEAMKRASLL